MIGFDTHVLIRYFVQDDPTQAKIASDLFDNLTEAEPGYIPIVTLVEMIWVLKRSYRVEKEPS